MTQTKPLLMGILNATPDSFFDNGAYFSMDSAVKRAHEICAEGADLIDVGGESSRPGALPVSEEEELRRIIPLIEVLSEEIAIPISIDSYKPEVVRQALEKGASLINDTTGFQNPLMREIAGSCEADLCVMHMNGTPETMQTNPSYPEGVVDHVLHFFDTQIELLEKEGVDKKRIILDPGIGFGKTLDHNLQLFHAIGKFKNYGLRILIGASRKGFMTRILGKPARELLPSTLAIHTMSLLSGADIIRVHDVKEHRDVIDVLVPLMDVKAEAEASVCS